MVMNEVQRIVLAGGPASGKSSVLKRLKQLRKEMDVNILYIDEVATAFLRDQPAIVGDRDDRVLRQYYILRTQMFIEEMLIQNIDNRKPTVLITDRGALDAYVYLTEEELLGFSGEHLERLYRRYDHIIYLEGCIENYLRDHETKRLEADRTALYETERKAYDVWHKCKSFSYIEQQDTIDHKVELVVNDIHHFLNRRVYCCNDM